MDKCRICEKSRLIISENGCKYICTLSQKKALQCTLDIVDHSVLMRKEIDKCD